MNLNTRKAALATVAALALSGIGAGVAVAGGAAPEHNRGRNDCANAGRSRHNSLSVVGLTAGNRLICFNEYKPGKPTDIGAIVGLAGDTKLVGIDYRPANGELIGLGNAGGVYSINPATAAATKKSQLDVALSGTSFGVDFNPTVDRLRITSDNGQNLRANVDTGVTVVDGALNYTAGTPAAGVAGSAYTNNDADPNTGTTLFDIDSALDQVVIQAPPNAGTLNLTGKLGVDTSAAVGSDIYSKIRGGTTVDVWGFASLTAGGKSGFYSVSLFTGKASARGSFPADTQVIGIAVPLNQV